jgi:hypothetical protein
MKEVNKNGLNEERSQGLLKKGPKMLWTSSKKEKREWSSRDQKDQENYIIKAKKIEEN